MEPTVQNTTTAFASRLRARVPAASGMPAASGNGMHTTAATGGNVLPRNTAGEGEQGVGIRVLATGGDV